MLVQAFEHLGGGIRPEDDQQRRQLLVAGHPGDLDCGNFSFHMN
jgi:hypothetical protein